MNTTAQLAMPLPDAATDAIRAWQTALRSLVDLGLVVTVGATRGDTVAVTVQATDAGRDALRRGIEMGDTS